MGKITNYFKRGFRYIFFDYKQPIVKAEIVQKKPNEMFKGKKYIITGGGSGLGFDIAKKLSREGALVILLGRNEEKLINACGNIKNSKYYVCDISDVDSSKKVFDDIFNEEKNIDGLVNNAGISLHEWDFLKVDKDGFDKQFYINLKGSYFLTQYYIDYQLKNNLPGNVIFISSEAGTMCDDLPYGLSKASINSLVQALSYNYYKNNIRVNAIAPGVTTSDMTKIKKNDDLFLNSNSGRYFVSEEVAEVVMFILSDYSKCISGEIIHTNAGNHIKKRY